MSDNERKLREKLKKYETGISTYLASCAARKATKPHGIDDEPIKV